MQELSALTGVLAALTVGVISPGPSFGKATARCRRRTPCRKRLAVASLGFDVALVTIVFAIEAGWYAIVALALSSERPRRAYLRYKAGVDRVAGGVMMLLGLKLVLSAQRA